MADQAVSNPTPRGDFLQHFESQIVCFKTGYLKNGTGVALEQFDMVATPLKTVGANYEPALEADAAAGITGWLIEDGYINMAVDEVTTRQVLVLARGPAAVVQEALPTNDPAGTLFTQASLLAALEAAGIEVVNTPPETSTQLT